MNDIPKLQEAICKLHGCESSHLESISVVETFQGQTVWEGTVELFKLVAHPKALRCYAWNHTKDEGGEKFYAVLELPPVDSAKRAVQVAIVAESKKAKP